MKPGASLFASGVVLGIAAGFLSGHLAVWSRISRPEEPSAATLPPLDIHNDVPTSPLSSWSTVAPLSVHSQSAPWLDSSDAPAEPVDEIQYFPAGSSQGTAGLARVCDATTPGVMAAGAEPDSLPDASDAAPIDAETLQSERITRSIIEEELPEASPQDVEIWFDALRGLSAEDVKGILRMRKNVNGLHGDGLPGAGEPLDIPHHSELAPLNLRKPEATIASHWQQLAAALDRARSVHVHNLANARSVGFKRLRVVWSDAALPASTAEPAQQSLGALGSNVSGLLIDMSPGQLVPTTRSLDLAIVGPGFLRVRQGDQIAYTRGGHLTINSDRSLAVLQDDGVWPLDPPVLIPEETTGVTIDRDGRVLVELDAAGEGSSEVAVMELTVFLDPSSLRPIGGGLLLPTERSGRPRTGTPAAEGCGELRQSMIEESNVDVDAELRALSEIDRWQSLLAPPRVLAPHVPAGLPTSPGAPSAPLDAGQVRLGRRAS